MRRLALGGTSGNLISFAVSIMPKHSSFASYSRRFVPGVKAQNWARRNVVDVDKLTQRLRHHRDKARERFAQNHPHASLWLAKRNLELGKIRLHSQKLLVGSGISAALMLSAPASPKLLPEKPAAVRLAAAGFNPTSTTTSRFLGMLTPLIPQRIGHLDPAVETQVSQIISASFGINASASLDHQRLNHSLGWIGYEQHLRRYPGDSLGQHDEEIQAGIAPGLGGWGYFASAEKGLDAEAILREKYYLAVPVMYLPNWKQDLAFLRDWYKFRKMLVVNVETGAAVVAVIGDAGPAAWTGKQFGGSPEVMRALDLTGKKSKGKVLIYFIDDPNNQVPLGPVKENISQAVQLT
ncbi:MAG: hypothetical protein HYS86_04305 [Candidatus Chisholmbacteria bacterium]|nr:hypothetical protein [Candidatus Chisholmbacteria bacterium]